MLEADRQTVRTTNYSTVADLINRLGCGQEDEHTTRVLRLVYVCRPYEDALEFVSRKCRIGRATDERQLSVSARALRTEVERFQ